MVPLLNIDLWEHAYFNEYDSRARYMQEIWRIIDWKRVAYRFENAKM
jgi:superoxide dismutase, Fe-Mn family